MAVVAADSAEQLDVVVAAVFAPSLVVFVVVLVVMIVGMLVGTPSAALAAPAPASLPTVGVVVPVLIVADRCFGVGKAVVAGIRLGPPARMLVVLWAAQPPEIVYQAHY